MISWFNQYDMDRCPSCSLKSSCTSAHCELRYLRRCHSELEEYRRRERVMRMPLNHRPLDLSLKQALLSAETKCNGHTF